ncbi:hypothetical protein ZWY2020_036502 [Hordeum vulgare]|nr:hypothetical protein ZWY2020_036502 [Hordeum vulgare]
MALRMAAAAFVRRLVPARPPALLAEAEAVTCGRGDKKTKRGKRFKGSYGNSRPKRDKKIERIKDRVEYPESPALGTARTLSCSGVDTARAFSVLNMYGTRAAQTEPAAAGGTPSEIPTARCTAGHAVVRTVPRPAPAVAVPLLPRPWRQRSVARHGDATSPPIRHVPPPRDSPSLNQPTNQPARNSRNRDAPGSTVPAVRAPVDAARAAYVAASLCHRNRKEAREGSGEEKQLGLSPGLS